MTFRTLNSGNYGIFLIMGDEGFISSTVVVIVMVCCTPESPQSHHSGLHILQVASSQQPFSVVFMFVHVEKDIQEGLA